MARKTDRSCSCSFTSVIYSSLSSETTFATFANPSPKCTCQHPSKAIVNERTTSPEPRKMDEPRFLANERTMISAGNKPFVPQAPEPVYKIKAAPIQNALHFEAEYSKVEKMAKNPSKWAKWVIPTDEKHTPFLSVIFMKGEKQVNHLPSIAEIPSFHRLSSTSLNGILRPPEGMIDLLNSVDLPSHISFDNLRIPMNNNQADSCFLSRVGGNLDSLYDIMGSSVDGSTNPTEYINSQRSSTNLQQKWKQHLEDHQPLYSSTSNTSVYEMREFPHDSSSQMSTSTSSLISQDDRVYSTTSQTTVTHVNSHISDVTSVDLENELAKMGEFLKKQHFQPEHSSRTISTANSISRMSAKKATDIFSSVSLATKTSSDVFNYCEKDGVPQSLLDYLSNLSHRSLLVASRTFLDWIKKGYSSCRSRGITDEPTTTSLPEP